jgi:hypothetical protein
MFTNDDGDQPGVIMNLYRFVKGRGAVYRLPDRRDLVRRRPGQTLAVHLRCCTTRLWPQLWRRAARAAALVGLLFSGLGIVRVPVKPFPDDLYRIERRGLGPIALFLAEG